MPGLAPADRGPVETGAAQPGDAKFVSVSTILGALDKPGLVYWSAEEAAKAAVEAMDNLPAMLESMGERDLVLWLRDACYRGVRGRRTAAELGSAVHHACEMYALTGSRPEVDAEVAPFLDRFEEWCDVAQPEYTAAELTVFSRTFGYAGTADCFLTLDGLPVIGDYKTSRKSVDNRGKPTTPYPEAALQLAGLRFCELAATWRARRYKPFNRRVYLLSDEEVLIGDPVPAVEGGVIIHITPEHCTAHPMICDERVWESFLHVLEVWRWNDGLAKVAVGAAIDYGAERSTTTNPT